MRKRASRSYRILFPESHRPFPRHLSPQSLITLTELENSNSDQPCDLRVAQALNVPQLTEPSSGNALLPVISLAVNCQRQSPKQFGFEGRSIENLGLHVDKSILDDRLPANAESLRASLR